MAFGIQDYSLVTVLALAQLQGHKSLLVGNTNSYRPQSVPKFSSPLVVHGYRLQAAMQTCVDSCCPHGGYRVTAPRALQETFQKKQLQGYMFWCVHGYRCGHSLGYSLGYRV